MTVVIGVLRRSDDRESCFRPRVRTNQKKIFARRAIEERSSRVNRALRTARKRFER